MNPSFAKEFAQEWVSAWNAADLERIFSHYADDFERKMIVEMRHSAHS